MDDLISRQAAIDALKRKQDDGKGDLSRFYNTIIQHDIEAIMQLPPIQPKPLQPWEVLAAQAVLSQPAKPKRGKWIDNGEAFICSECRSGYKEQPTLMGKPMFEFCPMCGAKMEVTT